MADSAVKAGSRGQRFLRWCVSVIWLCAITLLILIALYVGLGRQVMSNLHHFKPDIEQKVSLLVGQPVSMDRLRGDWQGLDPVLRVSGLEVGPEDDAARTASLGELRLRLDSWNSLRRLRLVFSEFSLSDGDATLVQKPDGRIGIEGVWFPPESETELYGLPDVAAAASESFETRARRWIREFGNVLSDPAVSIENLELRVKPSAAQAMDFIVPRMNLRFEEGIFTASGRVVRADDRSRAGMFALEGQHFFSGGFTGRLYTEVDSGRFFDAILRHYEWRNLSLIGMETAASGWFRFDDGRLMEAKGRLDFPFLQLRAKGNDIDPVHDLALMGAWERNGQGWQARMTAGGFAWRDYRTQSTSALIRQGPDGFSLRVDALDIAPARDLAAALGVLSATTQKEVLGYQPSGVARRLHVALSQERQWQVRGELEAVGLRPYEGMPLVGGVSGFFELTPDGGRLRLDPGPARLGFPELFTDNWAFSRLSGEIRWHRRGRGWWLESDNLMGHYGGAVMEAAFGMRLREEDDTLALRVGLADVDTRLLDVLVPGHVVPEMVYGVLSDGVERGRIRYGWYYGYGSIRDDPTLPAFSSAFEYRFEDADIAIADEWPALESASGVVRFQPWRGAVEFETASSGGIELDAGIVRFGQQDSGFRVDVNASASHDGEVLTRQWRESGPLRDAVGDGVGDVRLNGSAKASLAMSLWPWTNRQPEMDLSLDLSDSQLRVVSADLLWRELTGRVRYRTGKGFDDTDLEAVFLDRPVVISVRDEPGRALVIRQKGKLAIGALEKWLGSGIPWLNGQLSYEASLRPTESPRFRLNSEFTDLVSELPSPLAKRAGESHSLTATADFSSTGRLIVGGNWRPLGAFRMAFHDGAFQRGRIALGVRSTALPENRGLSLVGGIPDLDVSLWHETMARLYPEQWSDDPNRGAALPWEALSPMRFDLTIDDLVMMNRSMGAIRTEGQHSAESGWRIRLEGDRVEGEVLLPEDDLPRQVNLKNLNLPVSRTLDSAQSTDGVSPASWPSVDARIGNLRVQGRDFRDVRFQVRPGNESVDILGIRGSMGALDMTGDLTWHVGRDEGVSEFDGALSGGSLKGLEALLGQPVPIHNSSTEASVSLGWPGGPTELKLSSLNAELGFRLEDGTIEQGSEVARLFRVFGLLNTDTIWRRLKLDFSDVYGSGIPFDHMEGDILIHDGRLIFDPKVTIQSPSGGFRMSGEADLIDETLDMRLVVVLPITQNLPLAAVLFGFAPPVGGALFVIDQVFGGTLRRVTSATYSVGGTWNDPDVSLRNLFDTESDLENYERPDMEIEPGDDGEPAQEIRR